MPYMQMDEELASEKISIRNSAGGSFRKYGSTSNQSLRRQSSTANTNLIKHVVQPGDTLQGLALRYSVTMEQIRRTNRLWASDSLFLREYLLIPIEGDSPQILSPTSTVSIETSTSVGSTSTSRTNSVATDYADDEETSIDEFLGKIDSSIAQTKSVVQKCQNNSDFLGDFNPERTDKRKAVSRLRQSNNANSNNNVVVVSNSRQVRTSLQKMERQQDEMFEL